jgi:Zn-dependent protease with chaperone function
MDFFGRQAAARGLSRWLLGAFAIATGAVALAVALVLAVLINAAGTPEGHLPSATADPVVFVIAAMATAAFIGLASLWRLSGLRSGGGAVAVSLGGERVTGLEKDPLKRRLHNVVEEMAIAAGLPVPEVYILENEPGINAFAAGMQPANAAVAVTRGALERLTRDELQGVVAHEFSHILNGDMRLNARLMGYVFGLVAVSMAGRLLLRGAAIGGPRGRSGGRRGGGGGGATAALMAAGLAIVVLGSIGVLAGRILQAAVSRQREVLADASAVQFTRNPEGLANALKRIAASPLASSVRAVRREEIGHMLFASGRRSLAGLMATHPPVAERIRALDPHWKPGDPPPPPPPAREVAPVTTAAADSAGGRGAMPRLPGMPGLPGLDPIAAAAMVGVVDLAMAERLLAVVPESVHAAVLEPEGAAVTVLALLLDKEPAMRARQVNLLDARLGAAVVARITATADELAKFGPTLRLALLDLASPALHHLPVARRDDLVHLVQRMIELDGVISPQEAALAAALESRLTPESTGKPDPEGALAMLAMLARAGHDNDADAAAAWTRGAAKLEAGGFALPSPLPAFSDINPVAGAASARNAARLAAMEEPHRQLLMAALADVAAHDGVIRPNELQLLRAAAAALGCPMPPLDDQRIDSMR